MRKEKEKGREKRSRERASERFSKIRRDTATTIFSPSWAPEAFPESISIRFVGRVHPDEPETWSDPARIEPLSRFAAVSAGRDRPFSIRLLSAKRAYFELIVRSLLLALTPSPTPPPLGLNNRFSRAFPNGESAAAGYRRSNDVREMWPKVAKSW